VGGTFKIATTTEAKYELFAEFIQCTFADDERVPPDSGPEVVSNDPSFGSLQFSIAEVELILKDLDANKGPGPDKIPPSILKKCAGIGFTTPLCMIFNRSPVRASIRGRFFDPVVFGENLSSPRGHRGRPGVKLQFIFHENIQHITCFI
jgi:hypothetical protein